MVSGGRWWDTASVVKTTRSSAGAGMAMPVNACLDFPGGGDRAELVLRDLRKIDHLRIGGRSVPLAADWTASLAYLYRYAPKGNVGFMGLLHPADYDSQTDLYQLTPFDPDKIPVIFVHGLMSSPETWVDMVNELRADPVLRKNYQAVVFRYPTGYPIGRNAASLRAKLAAYRALYETPRSRKNMRQMVLIGHSMGGILSSWQIRDSGDAIRKMVLTVPLEELEVTPERAEGDREHHRVRRESRCAEGDLHGRAPPGKQGRVHLDRRTRIEVDQAAGRPSEGGTFPDPTREDSTA